MYILNGKKYAANNSEFTDSVFTGQSCNGFYRRIRGGIQLFNIKRELTAFVVLSTSRRFIVNASICNGRAWYLRGASDVVEKWIGIDGMKMGQIHDVIELSVAA